MVAVLVDVSREVVEKIAVEQNASGWRRIIHANSLALLRRRIGDHDYIIVCDKDSQTEKNSTPSSKTTDGAVDLHGSFLVLAEAWWDSPCLRGLCKEEVDEVFAAIIEMPRTAADLCGVGLLTACLD